VLTPDEAEALIQNDSRNKDVLFPYLNGEDLNSRPDQSPGRWVINFFDWPIERAMEYPDCFRIVEEKVKPERELNTYSRNAKEIWWQYERVRPELYATIAGMERVLVVSQTGRRWEPDFQPLGIVYSHSTIVFALSARADFAKMQAFPHEEWRLQYGPSLRMDARYTPSDCFETFPFPINLDGLESIGEQYNEFRRQIMQSRQEGLTKTYNRFHNEDEKAEDITELRRLHTEMDQAVAAAYGWSDLDLGHGFHETRQGLRYTLSEPARREILDRLLALNHQRYAEECRSGLHETKVKKGGAKGARKKAGGMWFEESPGLKTGSNGERTLKRPER
jgi:hypothetical protein